MRFQCFTSYLMEILVSEETTNGADKTIEPSNSSPGLNHTNSETSTGRGINLDKKIQYNESPLICLFMLDTEKDDTENVNWSKSSTEPIVTNCEDKQVASYQNISSDKIEGLHEKNRSSIQNNTSTRDDQKKG